MSPGPFFSITMASVWFINSFGAVLQGSLFGQLGTMPSTYSTLFLSGQGLAGIFAALAMLMSMASGVDAQTSALGYFITPCVGILMSIVCYLSLPHLKFARYYLAKKPSQAQRQELETKAELLQSDEKNEIPNSPQKAALPLDLDPEKEPEMEPEEPQKPGTPSVFIVFRKVWLDRALPSLPPHPWGREGCSLQPSPQTLRLDWGLRTPLVHPKVTGSWRVRDMLGQALVSCSRARAWAGGLGLQVGLRVCPASSHPCLWLPDLADGAVPCVGLRSHPVRLPCHHCHGDQLHWSWEVESVLQPHLLLPSLQCHGLPGTEPDLLLPVDEDSRLLPLLVCLRVLFVPLFMLCHVPERSRLPILFPQDAYFVTFMLLFAVSNGYLVSLTMCLAPRQVLPHEREVAGTLMTFFLALGLSCGASLSFLFKALL
ncbi:equilibrative nucleoside transporter 2 isoform X6 [Sus scrofa]|nr:equilibrative nucleoside transporter 2 isoform X6 [Sus scrofa]XP_020938463.1 equilibrative nucleoside transporter 2 isoform X6 [Sus scrofa]